jgi:hypothetical protein
MTVLIGYVILVIKMASLYWHYIHCEIRYPHYNDKVSKIRLDLQLVKGHTGQICTLHPPTAMMVMEKE